MFEDSFLVLFLCITLSFTLVNTIKHNGFFFSLLKENMSYFNEKIACMQIKICSIILDKAITSLVNCFEFLRISQHNVSGRPGGFILDHEFRQRERKDINVNE